MICRPACILLIASLLAGNAFAQGRPFAIATRVNQAPKLDGSLTDPVWLTTEPIRQFRQQEPHEGEPASEKTEVRILYTDHALYFGITCFDSEPQRLSATEMRRDVSQDFDDYFEIAIDSAHDLRNAYVFQINPLGTQRDGLITEEQGGGETDFDPGWDGVWISAARRNRSAWTATIEIPFSTLNLASSSNLVLGLNLKRFIRRNNEQDLWSAWQRTFGITKISEAGELRGLNEIRSKRLLIAKPYVLGGFRNLPPAAAGSGLEPGTTMQHTAGFDGKIGLRSNLVANFTVNTDFADADVDLTQFNLTPYKLFFPEKRQFFLENAGIFNFSLSGDTDQLFFSRNVGIDPNTGQEVPINGGGKLTGKLAGFDVGAMDVSTRAEGPNPSANFAVLRVKRSVFGDSYVGAMAVDKRSSNPLDPLNQAGGFDARFVIRKHLSIKAFAAATRGAQPLPDEGIVGVFAFYNSNLIDFGAGDRRVGRNFNPEAGFLEFNDCQCRFVDGTLKPRPHIAGIRELQFEGEILDRHDLEGPIKNQQWQATFRANFNNGAYTDDDLWIAQIQRITAPFNIYKNIVIPVGEYHWARHQLTYGSAQDRRFTWGVLERFGTYYDGRLNEARARFNYRANEHVSFDFSEQWNRFRLPQGNFSIVFGSLQTNYAFSRFLFLSAVLQMNTANPQAASANLRLRWNYRPDSDLFIVYTAGQRFASLAAANPLQLMEHRLAIKFTYSWSP
jgi:hypothetical protein